MLNARRRREAAGFAGGGRGDLMNFVLTSLCHVARLHCYQTPLYRFLSLQPFRFFLEFCFGAFALKS